MKTLTIKQLAMYELAKQTNFAQFKDWREKIMPGAFDEYFKNNCFSVPTGIYVIRDNWHKENGVIIREIVEAEFVR